MTRRIEQVNEQLRSELAELIQTEIELENGLITIARVRCSSDLRQAKIYITVLPDNLTGTALKKLRSYSRSFSRSLRKKLNLKYIPKFIWLIDEIEKEAGRIDDILDQIKPAG